MASFLPPGGPKGACAWDGEQWACCVPHLSPRQNIVSAAFGLWGDGVGEEVVRDTEEPPGRPLGSPRFKEGP